MYKKITLTNLFDLQVKHELPKKLPELSLVYTVVDDILDFPEELKQQFMGLNYKTTQ